MIPTGIWLQISEPGASDPSRMSRWNPVLFSSAALIELPVKLQRIPKGAKLEIKCHADDFLTFMKRSNIEGFEEGLWARFEATFYTEERLKRQVSVTTPWLLYHGGKLISLSPEDLKENTEANQTPDRTRVDAAADVTIPPQP
jgi:hypothetical protein